MASDFGNMVFHKCQRLLSVVGDGGKTNDMVYCKRNEGMASGNVIYFGGDVQVRNNLIDMNKLINRWGLD